MSNKNVDRMQNAFNALNDCMETIKDNLREPKYTAERLTEYVEGLFSFAKFKEGDEVRLNSYWEPHFHAVLESEPTHGWRNSKHFLIENAVATVRAVDYFHGVFTYDVVFDSESWVQDWGENKGKVNGVPKKDRHTYRIKELFLEGMA